MVRIVRDEPKRRSNWDKHGLDFAGLTPDFFDGARIVLAKGGRLAAIGPFGPVTMAVVFAPLAREAVSVISMRRANRKERRLS